MKYFKIYRKGCICSKVYYELTEGDFNVEVGDICNDLDTGDIPLTEDGMEDYEELDNRLSKIAEEVEKEAKSDGGYCAGDYYLYIRDDDADLFDMARPN